MYKVLDCSDVLGAVTQVNPQDLNAIIAHLGRQCNCNTCKPKENTNKAHRRLYCDARIVELENERKRL